MNPFDLPGPDFIGLYITVLAVAVGAAIALRWCLRLPAESGDLDVDDLSPYHMAWLAGGRERSVKAAAAALVQRRLLRLQDLPTALLVQGDCPADAEPLEREVHAAIADRAQYPIK